MYHKQIPRLTNFVTSYATYQLSHVFLRGKTKKPFNYFTGQKQPNHSQFLLLFLRLCFFSSSCLLRSLFTHFSFLCRRSLTYFFALLTISSSIFTVPHSLVIPDSFVLLVGIAATESAQERRKRGVRWLAKT